LQCNGADTSRALITLTSSQCLAAQGSVRKSDVECIFVCVRGCTYLCACVRALYNDIFVV
jgi:hypothetical protein